MTDRPSRRRASRLELRAWAWIAGGVAFFAPWAALGASPKPAVAASTVEEPRVIVVRTITRRVVITHQPAEVPVRYVTLTVPSQTSSASAPAAQAHPAPAATSTGGS